MGLNPLAILRVPSGSFWSESDLDRYRFVEAREVESER